MAALTHAASTLLPCHHGSQKPLGMSPQQLQLQRATSLYSRQVLLDGNSQHLSPSTMSSFQSSNSQTAFPFSPLRLSSRSSRGPRRKLRLNAMLATPPNPPAPQPVHHTTPPVAPPPPAPPVPRGIEDISNGDHVLGFGADLSPDHPGFLDVEYKRRRALIVDLAKMHRVGTPIPRIDYSPSEVAVWGAVFDSLTALYPTHACSTFLRTLPLFAFRRDAIPQLEDLSARLHALSGWRIRPVAGLLHPRDFLNGLAFRYFHSTQYIRHASQPMYTPEPDVCHELLGHVPMLADRDFAALAQAIGQASLGATDKQIWHLTKLYWYTVEFGTVMEEGEVRAFGAGLLSSFGELRYMRSGADDGRQPAFAPLDPLGPLPRMSYKDGFQRTYFLCDGFDDVARKLRAYAATIQAEGTRG
eukprot:TRINITY_DN70618_c0_g1_i1.p2 TRINITY_DN70618_c0_g1~~TRINITY_DN70618_c0_g1_i1.p2  ORF type:complete len:414 (-),score=-23.90 TRINITY_DN70618_c0_g1_i1:164-1405(-)